ncbi:MAG: acylphosphatase [Kiritimatiellia bacterium]
MEPVFRDRQNQELASVHRLLSQRCSEIRLILLSLVLLGSLLALVPALLAETNAPVTIRPSDAEAVTPMPGRDLKRIHVFISGKVQGVGFRDFTARQASRLKLTGWVKNLTDGRVELVAEGSTKDLETLLELVSQGPPAARVVGLEKHEENWSGEFKRFTVER